MGHQIEEINGIHSVFQVGKGNDGQKLVSPWHGLGIYLPESDGLTAEEAIIYANLQWEVSKQQMTASFNGQQIPVPNQFAIVREDEKNGGVVLGTVGNDYTPVQNTEAFTFFDQIDSDMKYVAGGALRGGQSIWLQAKLPDSIRIGEDIADCFVLLSNNHVGKESLTATISPIVTICANTLAANMRQAKRRVRIRHTTNVKDNLRYAAQVLGVAKKYNQAVEEVGNAMCKVKMTSKQFDLYLESLFPTPAEDSKLQNTAFKKLQEDITWAFENAPGSELKSRQGTLWGAYNAVTFVKTHAGDLDDNKLRSLMGGKRDEHMTMAWSAAETFMKSGVSGLEEMVRKAQASKANKKLYAGQLKNKATGNLTVDVTLG